MKFISFCVAVILLGMAFTTCSDALACTKGTTHEQHESETEDHCTSIFFCFLGAISFTVTSLVKEDDSIIPKVTHGNFELYNEYSFFFQTRAGNLLQWDNIKRRWN